MFKKCLSAKTKKIKKCFFTKIYMQLQTKFRKKCIFLTCKIVKTQTCMIFMF